MGFVEFLGSAPGILAIIGTLILGIVLLGIIKVGKENIKKVYGFAVVLLAIGLVWNYASEGTIAGMPLAAAPAPAVPGVPAAAAPGIERCYVEDTTKDLLLFEKYNPSTEATSEFLDVWEEVNVDGVFKSPTYIGRKAESSAITTSPGNRLTIVPAVNSSGDGYYGKIETEIVPCKGTDIYKGVISDVTAEAARSYDYLGMNAGATVTINNPDGTVNYKTENYTMGAGDIKTFTVTIDGPYEDEFSTAKICMICVGNKTTTDDIIVSGGGFVEKDCKPGYFDVGSNQRYDAYERVTSLTSLEHLELTITVDTDDTIHIGGTMAANEPGAVICFLEDQDVFVNTNTNLPEIGYETEQDVNVGYGAKAFNFSIGIA